MNDHNPQSLDLLGIKPVGEAINTAVKGSVEGAAAFLSRICLPAAEEFGLLLRDKVSNWRTKNMIQITEKAERKYKTNLGEDKRHAHPRMVSMALENGSWIESEEFQEMWAGLLASSCTEDGKDDSNLIFINLLSQLTALQAKIVNYACDKVVKKVSRPLGVVYSEELRISSGELISLTGVNDIHRLDRELDHLRALELIDPEHGGFPVVSEEDFAKVPTPGFRWIDKNTRKPLPDFDPSFAIVTPTALCLNLYVRCQGSLASPVDFFQLSTESSG